MSRAFDFELIVDVCRRAHEETRQEVVEHLAMVGREVARGARGE